jgi:DNA-binding PadR family transcriptional regulator
MNDLLLLANLLGGPLHGYALKKQVALISGNPAMHNNLVYPLLRRFVGKGWVRQKRTAGERGQTRVVYSLTPAGRVELLRRLGEFGDDEAHSSEAFQLRVGLFGFLQPAERAEILARRKNHLETRDQKLADLQKRFRLEGYSGEVVGFLLKQTRAELAWVSHLSRASSGARRENVRHRRES